MHRLAAGIDSALILRPTAEYQRSADMRLPAGAGDGFARRLGPP
jgi:hypothetical protein